MEEISQDEVLKIVKLSALDPGQEDISALTKEFNSILGYVRKLQEVDASSAAATSHVHGTTNVLREDAVEPSMPTEEGLANAPERVGSFIKVPLVVEG